jgi:tetratricopeptide (TPR) repeat protein
LQQKTKEKLAKAQQEASAFFTSHRDSILSAVEAAMDSSRYDSAVALTEKYKMTNDSALIALNATARKEAREDSIVTALKKLPSDGYLEKSEALYKQLVELDPSNKTYSDKYQYFSNKASEMRRLKREGEERARAEADRKTRIESQFSAWNGAHRELERVIKESMNDPDSYKHVETVYWDRGDYLVVKTTFRGKNAFGGVIKNSVTAKVSIDGHVLEILAQEP